MRDHKQSVRSAETAPLLRWVFERRGSTITCEVDVNDARACEVCLIPHWDVASSVVERFDGPMSALERHAELSRELRAAGWIVAEHTAL